MSNKWAWKVVMVPACLLTALGLLGALYPTLYLGYYLEHTAGTTIETLSGSHPKVLLLLDTIFRANGLGMSMSGILGVFIVLFAFRQGKRWSLAALAVVGGIGLVGEVLLEMVVL